MSSLFNYINNALLTDYSQPKLMSKTVFTKVELYTHKQSQKRIVLVSSLNRNDQVYRKLKEINNSNILKIYDVCSTDDHLYVLEEFVEGDTLSSKMQGRLLDPKEACKYMADVCNGLVQLHKNNIIHRDIKPSNIIITQCNSAVIIDFNIARLASEDKTDDTRNLGTTGYAAPEQYGIVQSSQATDIYPIGIMLNEMILGVHPTVNIPKGRVGKIINKCITTEMSKRYQSAERLKKELLRCSK